MKTKTFKEREAEFWTQFVAEEGNLRKTIDEKRGFSIFKKDGKIVKLTE